MIELTSYQLRQLLTSAANAGAQKALESLAPTEAVLSKSDVLRWFKRMGKGASLLKKLEEGGYLEGTRESDKSNGTIRYKRSDVQIALDALDIKNIMMHS